MARLILLLLLSGLPLGQTDSVRVHKQGTIEISTYFAVDVDEGKFERVRTTACADNCDSLELPSTPGFKGSDFWLQVDGKRAYLRPQHKARFSGGTIKPAGYLECSSTDYLRGKVRIDNLPKDTSICMRTSEGRYASVRIDGFDTKLGQLSLTFTSWEKENEVPAKK